MELFVNFPLVEERAEGHEPDFALRSTKQGNAIKDQPGKQLVVAYPTDPFFEGSSSLSTYLRVPRNIEAMIASL